MDLFRVSRFYGDDENPDDAATTEEEEKKFAKLMKKVKKRKRLRGNDSTEDNLEVTKEDSQIQKAMTKSEHAEDQALGVPNSEVEIEKKKRKKKKSSTSQDKDENHLSQENLGLQQLTEDSKEEDINVETSTDTQIPDAAEETTENSNEIEKLEVITKSSTGNCPKTKVKLKLPDWIENPIVIYKKPTEEINSSLEKCSYLLETSVQNLKSNSISELFCIQERVIPFLLNQYHGNTSCPLGGLPPRDICVSAPTGSGKTLCYALPIVQVLSTTRVVRLQCLVLSPSKDLASQIKTVFDLLVKGTRLKVGLAAGVKSFNREAEQLTKECSFGRMSSVDILIATPGRLIDHIAQTDGFTLAHLQFLIIDEADRLLGQSYYAWIDEIFNAIYHPKVKPKVSAWSNGTRVMHDQLPSSKLAEVGLPLHKLLFSATLTQNPEKLASLHLYNPILFLQTEKDSDLTGSMRFSTPETLTEKMVVCRPEDRPLILLHMIVNLGYKRLLCFTSSVEATHRLFLLLKLFGDLAVSEFSSSLNQTQRKGILRDFRAGKLDVLVCSDAMARGMDIEGVKCVVSYQPPTNIKTYIHRVGRTARAGQEGTAISILTSKEVHHFKEMISKAGSKLTKLIIKEKEYEPLLERYKCTLEEVKEKVRTEKIAKR